MITSTLPTSRRGYLSQIELEQFADITIIDITEADDRISQAEELIDAYVGSQNKFMGHELLGRVESATNNTITLQTNHKNRFHDNYFKLCEIEIVAGTGVGQRKKITDSAKESGVITLQSNWTTNPGTTSLYKIHQLGKFPRVQDARLFSETPPSIYFKTVPEAVKRATAAQVAYVIEMGDSYFRGDEVDKISESIGDYSYSKSSPSSPSTGGFAKLISPQAKLLLKGYTNRTGQILV